MSISHQKRFADPQLGIVRGSIAESAKFFDHDLAQKIWAELDASNPDNKDVVKDYSENGTLLFGGRYISASGRPFYWMVRDNRLHIVPSFHHLESEQDKMQLINQSLVAFANHSNKIDLKSAAVAVSELGTFYIAHNTQETNDWNKECAEMNLATTVKQLGKPNDRIKRIYVLGGLTDENGNMHVKDQLIGMCMRCVEGVSSLMSPKAVVTVIPANDGKASIALRETDNIADVKLNEAWQAPYAKLKGPSIITFSPEVNAQQKQAFEAMCEGLSPISGANLRSDGSAIPAERVNKFMIEHLAEKLAKRKGDVTSIAISVVEILENGKVRYEVSEEIRGKKYNAVPAPTSRAASVSQPIAESIHDAHINKIYFIGYNVDGSPYSSDTEQWDRAIKRTLRSDPKGPEVVFIPLNDGTYPHEDVQSKLLNDLVPTSFRGSKQHTSGADNCCPGH